MRIISLLLAGSLAACGVLAVTVPDTSSVPPSQFSSGINPDVQAMYLVQYSFADSSRLYGRPADAAVAAATMDYVAGEFYTSPRWANISALTKEQLLQGRIEVRNALGVAPGASSTAVVKQLSAAGAALAQNDQAAALAQLGAPVFQQPPAEVLARLGNLPYLRMANVSTMRAAEEMFQPGGTDWF